jgi:hypothetical protein
VLLPQVRSVIPVESHKNEGRNKHNFALRNKVKMSHKILLFKLEDNSEIFKLLNGTH